MRPSEHTKARELPISERASKRWSVTSKNIAIIFSEYPDAAFSAQDIYEIIRTWHLNTRGSKYSESAIRAVLMRFTRKGYLKAVKTGGKIVKLHYKATKKGHEIFSDFSKYRENGSSLDRGDLRRVLKAESSHVHQIEVGLRPWRELIGFDSGWKENTRITKVWLDPFIIQNIRTAIDVPPIGGNPAEWLTVRGDFFTLQVSKMRTVQLWVKGPGWRDELSKWLEEVPNLQEHHMDVLWNKINERAKNVVTTREYHVTDPELSKSRIQLFRGGRPRGWTTKDINEVREISRRDGGRVHRGIEGCRQRLRQPGRSVRSGSNISAHLRTRAVKDQGLDAARIYREVQGARGGLQEDHRGLGAQTLRVAVAGGVC